MSLPSRDGSIEVRLNADKSQAYAHLNPAQGQGTQLTLLDCLDVLKRMGIGFGIREGALYDALVKAIATRKPVTDILVAQGVLARNGEDAQIRYHLPREVVLKPLPRRQEDPSLTDWFALDPQKWVEAGEEVALIVPQTLGTNGKTVTWPIQTIYADSGRPARLLAGAGLRTSREGNALFATVDGYLHQQGDQLSVLAFTRVEKSLCSESLQFSGGGIFHAGLLHTRINANGTISVQGHCAFSRLRAREDVFLHTAEKSQIICGGNVYVTGSLKNCEVVCGKRIIALGNARLEGGHLSAAEEIIAWSLGSEAQTPMEIYVGTGHFASLREDEIEEEIEEAEANRERIRQAIKPFVTISASSALPEDRKSVLLKLQAQQRIQEDRITRLHIEKRQLQFDAKQKMSGSILVKKTLYPNVWVNIGKGRRRVEHQVEALRMSGDSETSDYRTEGIAA